jgi:hypothetical protein
MDEMKSRVAWRVGNEELEDAQEFITRVMIGIIRITLLCSAQRAHARQTTTPSVRMY